MLLVELYPPDIASAALRMHEMVNTFSEHVNTEIRVVVYNPLSKTRYLRHITKISDKVDVVRYGRKSLPRLFHIMQQINPFTLLCCTFFSIKETITYKPDIIIATIPSFIPAITAYVTSVIRKKPFCIDIRDNWINTNVIDYSVMSLPSYAKHPSRIMYKILHRLFLWSCKKALLLSIVYESMRDELLKYTNFKVPIIHVPNGVNFLDLDETKQKTDRNKVLAKYKIPEDRRSIIYVGALGGYYKPELLLEPLKKLVKKGYMINYIIVGDGETKNSIKKMAAVNEIEDRVFLIGKKTHSEVIELLLASDMSFYVLDTNFPNPDCALGTKVLEYIACKLPILSIADNNSIVSELVSKHRIGIALNWDEIAHMDITIEKLLKSHEYYENIKIYHPYFIEEFDRVKNNEKLYREIIEQYQRKSS